MTPIIKDIGLAAAGEQKIQWAWRHMPVLKQIAAEFEQTRPFAGLRVAVSIHVEAKTACLARTLVAGGAEVALTACNPLSTQDDIAAALAAGGMKVYCIYGASAAEYESHLQAALAIKPDLIIDDGGDLSALLHTQYQDLAANIRGACEETTTGIHRLRLLEESGQLLYPVLSVNDARCKHLFDNRYGTGQSVFTAIMATTNLIIAGKTIVVAGFGMCGRGVAMRAKGLGARIIVTEIDPVAACEALMEGYEVMPMAAAALEGDIFVTVTGCKDVITEEHFALMKDGAILCNAGHFDVEVNLRQLTELAVSKNDARNNIQEFKLQDGRSLYVLAEGRLVNLAAGDGHPAEIMDMSFALQALGLQYMAENAAVLEPAVYAMPAAIDDDVAWRLLAAKYIIIEHLTPEQEYYLGHWLDNEG
ncbi:MAG: adenosylhomocysteinase [Ruminococcaceae bacterium]|nr:adenosylhomocysteinase [Oscillospiraceae bacterium]